MSYPRNDPTGVLTAETMYTGGRFDMVASWDLGYLRKRLGREEEVKRQY